MLVFISFILSLCFPEKVHLWEELAEFKWKDWWKSSLKILISLNYCKVDACSPWFESNGPKLNALWVDPLEQGAMKLGRWMVKMTLGVDSERQIIKSNLLLLGLECQQERRYLSRTLFISSGQRQPRCFPVKRTHHAYTGCLEQEGGPGPSTMSWHGEYASGRTSSKWGAEAFGKAATKPGHLWADANCTLPPLPNSTHTLVWAQQHSEAVSVLVAKVSDTGALQDQADTDQAMHHEHQQLCLGQVLSSAAGLAQWSS